MGEQLGYTVSGDLRNTFSILGFCIRITSSNYPPSYLHSRVEQFLIKFRESLENPEAEKEFESNLVGLINQKLEKITTLSEVGRQYNNLIADKIYNFNTKYNECRHMLQLKLQDVIKFFDTYLNPLTVDVSNIRHLCVYITGRNDNERNRSTNRSRTDSCCSTNSNRSRRESDASMEEIIGEGEDRSFSSTQASESRGGPSFEPNGEALVSVIQKLSSYKFRENIIYNSLEELKKKILCNRIRCCKYNYSSDSRPQEDSNDASRPIINPELTEQYYPPFY